MCSLGIALWCRPELRRVTRVAVFCSVGRVVRGSVREKYGEICLHVWAWD